MLFKRNRSLARGKRRSAKAAGLNYQSLEQRQLLAVVISEFLASNVASQKDGYGNTPDWIELHNTGTSSVDLSGYHLTDDANALSQWAFPNSTSIAANDYLVVFASGKDEVDPLGNFHTNFKLSTSGEYLALSDASGTVVSEFGLNGADYPAQIDDVSYGVTGKVFLDGTSDSHYLIPSNGNLGTSWTNNGFDPVANGFTASTASIGYENNPNSGTSYQNEISTFLPSGTTSTYLRTEFTVADASAVTDLTLGIKYDDGFGVYLNGTLLLSENANNGLDFNDTASGNHNDFDALQFQTYSLDAHVGLLVDGTNTLAVHALNFSSGSSDYLLIPRLTSNSPGAGGTGYLAQPTPGGANADQIALGPAIENVTKNPIVNPGESLVVTAEVSDFSFALNPNSVELHYRQGFNNEVTLAARDDGTGGDATADDGIFSATIPNVGAAGDLIRWYFTADDVEGNQTRAPRFAYALNSAEYFGTVVSDPSYTSDVPAFHWFLEDPAGASTDAGARGALFLNGELYDNIEANAHGQSTRGSAFPKKSFDFDANSGDKFLIRDDIGRASDFNLLTNYGDQSKIRNSIGYDIWQESGHPASLETFSVAVFQNGAFYGLYDLVEEGDEEFLNREGLDEDGALYKVNNKLSSSTSAVDKRSRNYEDNSDLQLLIDAEQTLSGSAYATWILDNVETATLINYLAVNSIIGNTDFGHKNMHWYMDTNGTGQWSTIPWDIDLSFGHRWNSTDLYFDNDMLTNVDSTPGLNELFGTVYSNSTMREMFDRRLRSLSDQFLGTPGTAAASTHLGQKIADFENLLGSLPVDDLAEWGQHANFAAAYPFNPAQAIDQIRDVYIDGRRQFLTSRSGVPNSQVGNPNILFSSDFDQSPVSGLQAEEYLRLDNPNNTAVDISGWKIRGGIDHEFLAGSVIPANGSLYVVKDVVAFKARTTGPRGGQSLFIQGNYSGQMASSGETIELIAADGSVIDTLMTPDLGLSNNQQYLQITEINYDPAVENAEFLELMNISSGGAAVTLNLAGVAITEGPSDPFVFAAGTTLAAGERILVVKDLAAFTAAHPGVSASLIAGEFAGSLSNNGETLRVEDAGGERILDFDYGTSDPWSTAADGAGASLQLIDEATPNDLLGKYYSWRSSHRTGGTPGTSPLADPTPIVINEVLAHTDLPQTDSIELFNPSSTAIDVGGWFLSDQKSQLRKFEIPAGTTIAAGGYLVFDESDFNPTPLNPGANDFALSSTGDSVYLTSPIDAQTNTFVDAVRFGATFNGDSIGRLPNGLGRFTRQDENSFGAENTRHEFSDLLISEVNYHPDAPASNATITQQQLEFIEIFNPATTTMDLTDWRIRGEVDFNFAAGASIAAGQAIVVVAFDPDDVANAGLVAEFRSHYGIGASVILVGGYSNNLSNSFGRVSLQQPGIENVDGVPRIVVDEVVYDDRAPFEDADGNGSSLHREHTNSHGIDSASWTGAAPTPGNSPMATAAVEARAVFYNNSDFDGNAGALNDDDYQAIALGKTALLPSETATFENYTSFSGGLNGVFIDVQNLPAGVVLSESDFTLATGNGSTLSDFTQSSATFDIEVLRGDGVDGKDRIGLVFADGTFANTWLQVTLLANANTRLDSNDVFYFGNAIGETGDSASNASVSSVDVLLTRGNRTSPFTSADRENRFDFNRDSKVDTVDVLIARRNRTNPFNQLQLITAPTVGGGGGASLTVGSGSSDGSNGNSLSLLGFNFGGSNRIISSYRFVVTQFEGDSAFMTIDSEISRLETIYSSQAGIQYSPDAGLPPRILLQEFEPTSTPESVEPADRQIRESLVTAKQLAFSTLSTLEPLHDNEFATDEAFAMPLASSDEQQPRTSFEETFDEAFIDLESIT